MGDSDLPLVTWALDDVAEEEGTLLGYWDQIGEVALGPAELSTAATRTVPLQLMGEKKWTKNKQQVKLSLFVHGL